MAFKVVAPLVIAKDESGRPHYFYEGAVLPDNITDDECKRLKAEGMIADEKAVEKAAKSGEELKLPGSK